MHCATVLDFCDMHAPKPKRRNSKDHGVLSPLGREDIGWGEDIGGGGGLVVTENDENRLVGQRLINMLNIDENQLVDHLVDQQLTNMLN